jgi:glycosyltransferase involved in cell wall biosynthesis
VLEKRVLHAASRIITTNRRVKELILQRFKFIHYNDVTILPQGFDPADFTEGIVLVRNAAKMRITHAGLFYGDRTPKYFFLALRKLFADRPELKQKLELYFVGTMLDEHIELVRSMGLEENVTLTGYLDHVRCVQMLTSSDVLWLMLDNDRQSPGKVYEYLGARKPILACVPEGFIRQTLKEAGCSYIVSPSDVDGIAAALNELYDLYRQDKLPKPSEEVVLNYDRIELTNELAKLFGFLAE